MYTDYHEIIRNNKNTLTLFKVKWLFCDWIHDYEDYLFVVMDTCALISHVIDERVLYDMIFKHTGISEDKVLIYIPYQVRHELQDLKAKTIGPYITICLKFKRSNVVWQHPLEFNTEVIYSQEIDDLLEQKTGIVRSAPTGDDRIFMTTIILKEYVNTVVFVSKDKRLLSKTKLNGINTIESNSTSLIRR